LTDGRVNARVKCDLTDDLALKANAQVKYMLISPYFWISFLLYACFFFFPNACKSYDLHVNFLNYVIFFSMQLTNEPHMSHVMLNFDYKVKLSLPFRSVHIFCMIILLSQTMEVGVPDIVLL
jgi:hypothetical protein